MDFCLLLKTKVEIKESATDAITASKRAKTTGDLIGNKIADKITNLSKKS